MIILKKITAGILVLGGLGVAPIIPQDMTFDSASQHVVADLVKFQLNATSTFPFKYIDDDNDGIVSIARFKDSNGKFYYMQISEERYAQMGLVGGERNNPTKTEFSSILGGLTKKAEAAIAFDAVSTHDQPTPSTSTTFSHTVAATGNPLLLVGTNPDSSVSTTDCAYNGTAMTKQNEYAITGAATQRNGLWFLLNPATGAHNIVCNYSGSATPSVRGISYTGVAQTGFPDAFDNEDQAATANLTSTITTVANNAWTAIIVRSNASNSSGAGGTTCRSVGSDAFLFCDSNAAITPAGSTSLTSTGGSSYHAHIMVSFAPFVAAVDVPAPEQEIIDFQ